MTPLSDGRYTVGRQTLKGFVVLYTNRRKPWLLGNVVYPTKDAATAAAERANLMDYEVNAVAIDIPSAAVLAPAVGR